MACCLPTGTEKGRNDEGATNSVTGSGNSTYIEKPSKGLYWHTAFD